MVLCKATFVRTSSIILGGKVMNLIDAIEKENLKPEVTSFDVGDTVKVNYKIIEGKRERILTLLLLLLSSFSEKEKKRKRMRKSRIS